MIKQLNGAIDRKRKSIIFINKLTVMTANINIYQTQISSKFSCTYSFRLYTVDLNIFVR